MWSFCITDQSILAFSFSHSVLRDYCLRDTFEAKCHHSEVAVITSARYGRRQLGKCIRKDFGYLGCGQEVISQADRICSGRQQCSIDVFKTFGSLKPCSELESYLEADYDCIPGEILHELFRMLLWLTGGASESNYPNHVLFPLSSPMRLNQLNFTQSKLDQFCVAKIC